MATAPSVTVVANLTVDTNDVRPPAKGTLVAGSAQIPKELRIHPTNPGGENATLTFVGTATTLLEWRGLRIMTDPNFLHAGGALFRSVLLMLLSDVNHTDHVHLGPGVTAQRLTNPSVPLDELPPVHLILLSHYHEDHFDKVVEDRLRRDLPIITTPHAHHHLAEAQAKGEPFTAVTALDTWQAADVRAFGNFGEAKLKVIAMPGKHVPPGILDTVNNVLGAVPPTNGWMVELLGDEGRTGSTSAAIH